MFPRDDGVGPLGWRRPVAVIVATTAAIVVAMVLTGMGPRLVLVAALGALCGLAVWLTVTLGAVAAPADPWAGPRSTTPTATHATAQISALRSRITYGHHGGAERLHALLVELLDDQVAAVHGIDRATDPDTARALLGDDLFAFAADPTSARSLTRRRALERVVDRIESI